MPNTTSCAVCHGSDLKRALHDPGNTEVLRCNYCGLGITALSPLSPTSCDIYGMEYFTGGGKAGINFFDELMAKYDKSRFEAELDDLGRLVRPGKLIDVGCATGNFLSFAQKRGWEIYGYDISEFAVRTVQERLIGGRAAAGRLGPDTFPGVRFDVVTLHHVLEHVEDPVQFLEKQIFPLLAKKGLVLIEVPNFDSIEAKAAGLKWEDLRPEQHRWHFTHKSLKMLVEKAGGKTVRLYTLGNPLWRIRTFADYIMMLASVLFSVPYSGQVGRDTGPKKGSCCLNAALAENTGALRSALYWTTYIAGMPVSALINRGMMGKRLVLIAGNSREDR